MADKGTIVTRLVDDGVIMISIPLNTPTALGVPANPRKSFHIPVKERRFPIEIDNYANSFNTPCDKAISGTVNNGGTPVAGAEVWLIHRKTAALIGRTLTSATGAFTFTSLPLASKAYLVIALDVSTGDQLDALIHDYLTPV